MPFLGISGIPNPIKGLKKRVEKATNFIAKLLHHQLYQILKKI